MKQFSNPEMEIIIPFLTAGIVADNQRPLDVIS